MSKVLLRLAAPQLQAETRCGLETLSTNTGCEAFGESGSHACLLLLP